MESINPKVQLKHLLKNPGVSYELFKQHLEEDIKAYGANPIYSYAVQESFPEFCEAKKWEPTIRMVKEKAIDIISWAHWLPHDQIQIEVSTRSTWPHDNLISFCAFLVILPKEKQDCGCCP